MIYAGKVPFQVGKELIKWWIEGWMTPTTCTSRFLISGCWNLANFSYMAQQKSLLELHRTSMFSGDCAGFNM